MDFLDGLKQMRSYGGLRLAVEYFRMGLAGKIFKQSVSYILHGKPVKKVYYDTNKWVGAILLDKYELLIQDSLTKYRPLSLIHDRSDIVWFCWLQGEENMPDIVRACYNSQRSHIRDKEFRFIDRNSWRDYITIPDYLVEKYEKGVMPASMFTDLIRLELLIKHGGTWIDATVLCSGEYDPRYFDSDIFFYQYRKSGGLSNWFITSCSNNPMLMVIRDVLHAYWKEYDVVVDYFIFHLILGRLMPEFPEMIGNMPCADSYQAISLVNNWHKPFRQSSWDKLTANVHFHKLAWKVSRNTIKDKDNYYNFIIQNFS